MGKMTPISNLNNDRDLLQYWRVLVWSITAFYGLNAVVIYFIASHLLSDCRLGMFHALSLLL